MRRRPLDGERDLGAREARVVPVGHEHRARVAAFASERAVGSCSGPRSLRRCRSACRRARAAGPARCAARRTRHSARAASATVDERRPPEHPRERRHSSSVRPLSSASAAARSGESAPESRRLPRQPMPKRVGSSAVKTTISIDRRGWNPCAAARDTLRARRARPRRRRTGRRWESRRCASRSRRPAPPSAPPRQRAKMFPTASSRSSRPPRRAARASPRRGRRDRRPRTARA